MKIKIRNTNFSDALSFDDGLRNDNSRTSVRDLTRWDLSRLHTLTLTETALYLPTLLNSTLNNLIQFSLQFILPLLYLDYSTLTYSTLHLIPLSLV